jgi:hypothetical protein
MAEKTDAKDAEGWAKVVQALRDRGHKFPHAFIAAQIDQSRQSVIAWKAVPINHVAKLAELSGIPPNEISPHALKKMKELLL